MQNTYKKKKRKDGIIEHPLKEDVLQRKGVYDAVVVMEHKKKFYLWYPNKGNKFVIKDGYDTGGTGPFPNLMSAIRWYTNGGR